jgi:ribosomal protein S18 acetylase RimI-like enzyme
MRSAREEDLPHLLELWREEVALGRQDIVPGEARLRRMLGRYDWDSKSRVVEREGRLAGSVLVMSRPSTEGVMANIYAAGTADVYLEMVRWGVDFCRAAGATITQLFVGKGCGDGLEKVGLHRVRPWWRMDRGIDGGLPRALPVAGYEMLDGKTAPDSWAELFNETFADHWRFTPRVEEEIIADKLPQLCLMAVTARDRKPVALTLGEIETYDGDPRPQPVGLISSVGTLPEHRRRGLATWLVADVLQRLQASGARHLSLYVDGANHTRAHEAYEKLGFEITFEAEVWEAKAA